MELTYHCKGDYLFPNLTVEEEEVKIGKYGMLRRTFLKEHKNSLYQSLFLTGKLNSHLEQIEKAAQESWRRIQHRTRKQIRWHGRHT